MRAIKDWAEAHMDEIQAARVSDDEADRASVPVGAA